MTGWPRTTPLAQAVYLAGFEYEATQDILKSRIDAPLQSRAGFNWAYDVMSARLLMILDCETFYFAHKGKKWLIELWKGQYGLETGCEIGVYNAVDHSAQLAKADERTAGPAVVPRFAVVRGAAHNAIHAARALYRDPVLGAYASSKELLTMSLTLRRHNSVLLHRGPEPHWWLTGFKWGVFTRYTSDLTVDVAITLLDEEMYEKFRTAVILKGYSVTDKGGLKLGFTFGQPRTTQPPSRTSSEEDVQAINEHLVERYCALRNDLKLPNNDPNGFDMKTLGAYFAPKAAHQIVTVAKKLEHGAALAGAKKLHQAADALHHVHDDVADARSTAYHDVLQFFERGWHSSRSANA